MVYCCLLVTFSIEIINLNFASCNISHLLAQSDVREDVHMYPLHISTNCHHTCVFWQNLISPLGHNVIYLPLLDPTPQGQQENMPG